MDDRVRNVCWFVGIFAISFFMYYWMRLGGEARIVNADETSCYFLAEDMFRGNIWLKDWHLSTGVFLLPSIEVYLLSNLLGYHDIVFYFAGSINYALMLSTTFYFVYHEGRKLNLKYKWFYPIATWMFVLVPRMEGYMYNSCTHTLAITVGIWSFFILSFFAIKIASGRNIYCLCIVLYIFGTGWLSVTNTIYMYVCLFPMVCIGLYLIYSGTIKQGIFFVIVGNLSLITAGLIKSCYIIERDGLPLGSIKTAFLDQHHIMESIQATFVSVLKVFWIDIWGHSVYSVPTFIAIAGFIIMIKLGYEIRRYLKNVILHKNNLAIFYFLFMGTVNILANAFAGLSTYDVHLFQPALLGFSTAGVLCWMNNIHFYGERRNELFASALLVIGLFIAVLPSLSHHRPPNMFDSAAKYLVEHGYKNGVGGFWSASTTMYRSKNYSQDGLTIYPMQKSGRCGLQEYAWMSKGELVNTKVDYCVFLKEVLAAEGIRETDLIHTFGPYSKKIEFETCKNKGVVLYLWDKKGYINCVDKDETLQKYMRFSDKKMLQNDGSVIVRNHEVMFGPYQKFNAGTYQLCIQCADVSSHSLLITAESGKQQLCAFPLHNGWNQFTFSLQSITNNIEFVVHGNKNSELHISKLRINELH